MITIFGAGKNASYEEIGAIELLRTQGVDVEVCLPPDVSDGDVHAAKLILSHFHVDVYRYYEGAFAEIERLFVFGRLEVFNIMREHQDKPRWVFYSPDSSLPSRAEIEALKDNLIDEIFTKSSFTAIPYARELVLQANKGVEHKLGYVPFCNPDSNFTKLKFQEKPETGEFIILQHSPDHCDYCFPDNWKTLTRITTPRDRFKKVRALGWGPNKARRSGDILSERCKWSGELNVSLLNRQPHWEELCNEYARASVALNFYPFEEPFSFQTAKAILSGVAVVAGASRAQRELLKHGESGFIAHDANEAAYLVSRLAWEPGLMSGIALRAYSDFIANGPGNMDKCLTWWGKTGIV